jgi:hypothetical protein
VDPVLAHVCRGLLALVFLSAVAHKLQAPRDFLATLRGYGLVPRSTAPAVAVLLVGAELVIGTGLLAPATQRMAALGATALLGLYGASIAINLLRGRRDIDCGCGGPAARQPLSDWLVLRNVVLAAAGVAALLPGSSRPLEVLDWFTIAAAVAVLFLQYLALNLLLAYQPRTRALA